MVISLHVVQAHVMHHLSDSDQTIISTLVHKTHSYWPTDGLWMSEAMWFVYYPPEVK